MHKKVACQILKTCRIFQGGALEKEDIVELWERSMKREAGLCNAVEMFPAARDALCLWASCYVFTREVTFPVNVGLDLSFWTKGWVLEESRGRK